jgi:hypothetical protein
MATIQRNVKTYGNRSFVGEVSSAPSNQAPILSNEVDADLDTIYAAWNGGTDTVNVKDGSVTFAKLAPDAQLWRDTGTTITPGTNFAARPIVAVPGDATGATLLLGNATAKGRVQGLTTTPGTLGILANRNWAASNAQDDATKPSWGVLLNCAADTFAVQRAPAGSTTQTALLTLDNGGSLTATGNLAATGATLNLGPSNRGAILSWIPAAGQCATDVITNAGQAYAPARPVWIMRLNTNDDTVSFMRQAPSGGGWQTLAWVGFAGDFAIAGSTGQKASGTTWSNPSDPRLKKDIADYPHGLSDILKLKPISYTLKASDTKTCGFDAGQVRDVFPECISTTRMKLDPADEEETEDVLTFDMHPILVALVNAVKELAARVATLEGAAA